MCVSEMDYFNLVVQSIDVKSMLLHISAVTHLTITFVNLFPVRCAIWKK